MRFVPSTWELVITGLEVWPRAAVARHAQNADMSQTASLRLQFIQKPLGILDANKELRTALNIVKTRMRLVHSLQSAAVDRKGRRRRSNAITTTRTKRLPAPSGSSPAN